jgi:hypothetical protein
MEAVELAVRNRLSSVQVISDLDDEDESRMVNALEDKIFASSEVGLMDVSTRSSVASLKESCEFHMPILPQARRKKNIKNQPRTSSRRWPKPR